MIVGNFDLGQSAYSTTYFCGEERRFRSKLAARLEKLACVLVDAAYLLYWGVGRLAAITSTSTSSSMIGSAMWGRANRAAPRVLTRRPKTDFAVVSAAGKVVGPGILC